MSFRNPVRRLSQLVADVITGALIRTAASGGRIEIYQAAGTPLPGWKPSRGLVEFYVTGEDAPGGLEAYQSYAGTEFYLSMFGPQINGHAGWLQLYADAAADYILANSPVYFGGLGNGSPLAGVDFGAFTGNTDASGNVTVPHALGSTPTVEFALQTNGSNGWTPMRAAKTGSDITWKMRNTVTNAVAPAGTNVTFVWFAIE